MSLVSLYLVFETTSLMLCMMPPCLLVRLVLAWYLGDLFPDWLNTTK